MVPASLHRHLQYLLNISGKDFKGTTTEEQKHLEFQSEGIPLTNSLRTPQSFGSLPMDNKEFCPLILDSNQCLLLPTETSFTSRKINIRQQNLNEMHPTLNVLYFAEFPADAFIQKAIIFSNEQLLSRPNCLKVQGCCHPKVITGSSTYSAGSIYPCLIPT